MRDRNTFTRVQLEAAHEAALVADARRTAWEARRPVVDAFAAVQEAARNIALGQEAEREAFRVTRTLTSRRAR
jgi:hypothetical protein